jgi:hypothetical protein
MINNQLIKFIIKLKNKLVKINKIFNYPHYLVKDTLKEWLLPYHYASSNK